MHIKDKVQEQEEFLNNIYREYRRLMLRIARTYTDDAQACEDIVHNGFMSVIRNKEKIFEFPKPKVKAYIILATRHASIDYLRKERRMNMVDIPDDILVDLISRSQERLTGSEIPFRTVEFYTLIRKLPEEDQTLLIGHYMVGLDGNELARLVGCKPDTLRVKLYRARKRALAMFKSLGLRLEDFI